MTRNITKQIRSIFDAAPAGLFTGVKTMALAAALSAGAPTPAVAQAPTQEQTGGTPEWTTVTMTLTGLPESSEPGGVVFFLSQRRLIEIPPGPAALEAIAARSEGSAPVSSKGEVQVILPPGNYLAAWDPNAGANSEGAITSPAATDPQKSLGRLGRPGPESLQALGTEPDARDKASAARLQAIRKAGESGLPVVVQGNQLNLQGTQADILPVYIAFNRFVRPPEVDFGTWSAATPERGNVTIRLMDKAGEPSVRGTLRIRGNNGDLLEPLPTGRVQLPESLGFATGPGVFVFRDVYSQPYQAVLQSSPPPPPAGAAPGSRASEVLGNVDVPKPTDRPTDRTISNPDFVSDGEKLELTMTLKPIAE